MKINEFKLNEVGEQGFDTVASAAKGTVQGVADATKAWREKRAFINRFTRDGMMAVKYGIGAGQIDPNARYQLAQPKGKSQLGTGAGGTSAGTAGTATGGTSAGAAGTATGGTSAGAAGSTGAAGTQPQTAVDPKIQAARDKQQAAQAKARADIDSKTTVTPAAEPAAEPATTPTTSATAKPRLRQDPTGEWKPTPAAQPAAKQPHQSLRQKMLAKGLDNPRLRRLEESRLQELYLQLITEDSVGEALRKRGHDPRLIIQRIENLLARHASGRKDRRDYEEKMGLEEGPKFDKFGRAIGNVAGMAAKGLGAVAGGVRGSWDAIKKGYQAGKDTVGSAGHAKAPTAPTLTPTQTASASSGTGAAGAATGGSRIEPTVGDTSKINQPASNPTTATSGSKPSATPTSNGQPKPALTPQPAPAPQPGGQPKPGAMSLGNWIQKNHVTKFIGDKAYDSRISKELSKVTQPTLKIALNNVGKIVHDIRKFQGQGAGSY